LENKENQIRKLILLAPSCRFVRYCILISVLG